MSSRIVQTEYVIQHVKASLRCWYQMEHLAELEGVLFAGELEVTADEDEHAAGGAGGLAIDGGDAVLALLEREAGELGDDVWGALDLLTLESEHGLVLV